MLDPRLGFSLWALRLACGVFPIVSGLEKFNGLGLWTRAAGVVELVAGVLIFTPYTRLAALFLSGWLLLLAALAVAGGTYDMAVRGVLLAVGAFVLSRLTRVNEARRVSSASGLGPVAEKQDESPAELAAPRR